MAFPRQCHRRRIQCGCHPGRQHCLGKLDPGWDHTPTITQCAGLQIVNFPGGIDVIGHNNHIGVTRLVGSGPTGQGNVISGNRQVGIPYWWLWQPGPRQPGRAECHRNTCYPNHWGGITFNGPDNTLGSLNPGEDNVISANDDAGITMYGYNVSGNQIIGNKIGTDITGNVNLGNKIIGVYVECGANNTLCMAT